MAGPSRRGLAEAVNTDALHLTLHFKNGAGITKNTEIRYQGIAIGKVTAINLDPGSDQIHGEACVPKEMARVLGTRAASVLV